MTISRLVLSLLAAVFAALSAGCITGEPFTRPPLPVLKDPDPAAIRETFTQNTAAFYVSDDTVIIQAPFRDDMAVLGVLRVDRPNERFELLGMNHLGVKFFHLAGEGDTTTIRYAVPMLEEKKEILLSIADDIRRCYFHTSPPASAGIQIDPTLLHYTAQTPDGQLIYEFGGTPTVLLEKRLDGFFGTIWRIRYYDYNEDSGKLYPRGIVIDNHRFNYRIIVKNRQWQIKEH